MKRKTFSTDEHSYTAYIKTFASDFFVASLVSLTKHTTELFYNTSEVLILEEIKKHITEKDSDIIYESNFFRTY